MQIVWLSMYYVFIVSISGMSMQKFEIPQTMRYFFQFSECCRCYSPFFAYDKNLPQVPNNHYQGGRLIPLVGRNLSTVYDLVNFAFDRLKEQSIVHTSVITTYSDKVIHQFLRKCSFWNRVLNKDEGNRLKRVH